MKTGTLITGFPRIGEKRELKQALEAYWAGRIPREELERTAAGLREQHWRLQQRLGIDLISANDFSTYDNMLDTAVMLNAIPRRFRGIDDATDRYFAMARGSRAAVAMEMTKWFNTNYHFIVPELEADATFALDTSKIMRELNEARALGIATKVNLIGPITFLALSKASDGHDPYDHFDAVLAVYKHLMLELAALDDALVVQIDEPVFARDPDARQLTLLERAYRALPAVSANIRIIVTTYFEHSNEATRILADTPVWGIGLDFVHGPRNLDGIGQLNGKQLIAGVVDGRNIWAADLGKAVALLDAIAKRIPPESITVASSCSLLHCPFTIANEPDSDVKRWLAFASEKVAEVAQINALFRAGGTSDQAREVITANRRLLDARSAAATEAAGIRTAAPPRTGREGDFSTRIALQKEQLALPELPTTTIGSFPQTPALRTLRRDFKRGDLSRDAYEAGIKQYIDDCVAFQEEIGLDVLVHGEPERNDMVEYFGELLNGFHFTRNGWVQSYGSRCVKPPIIYGDVSRPAPMTVDWITYAQGRTRKIMKGMLTGPVTILNWSFVRNDRPRAEVSRQLAIALSDEVDDLQNAGIKVIQVDEAAFKEGYPLRRENIPAYERWALESFRIAVGTARMETQIHTHMCYSEFNDIIRTIEAMDADVITIETARSGNKLLHIFKQSGYANEIGPGVYDIHAPRIPSVEEFKAQILERLEVLARSKTWINPDCGLKTRTWDEVKPALRNMVAATRAVRREISAKAGGRQRQR